MLSYLLSALACFVSFMFLGPRPCLGGGQAPPYEASIAVMGTVGKVQIWGLPEREARAVSEEIFTVWKDVDKTMSLYKPQSDLVALNNHAGQAPLTVSRDLIRILRLARIYEKRTGGIFDVRVGRLMELWGLGVVPRDGMPGRPEIIRTLRQAKRAQVVLYPAEGQVQIRGDGAKIDLGGIAKGYALDKSCDRLRARGVPKALLDLGGQLMLWNPPPEGWIIGVREPGSDNIVGTLCIKKTCSISVSSQEERFRFRGKMRIGHVLDMRTGRPVRRRGSLSVVAVSATQADVLSTAFLVAGEEGAKTLLKDFPDIQVLRVMPAARDGGENHSWRFWESRGMEKLFSARKSSMNF